MLSIYCGNFIGNMKHAQYNETEVKVMWEMEIICERIGITNTIITMFPRDTQCASELCDRCIMTSPNGNIFRVTGPL